MLVWQSVSVNLKKDKFLQEEGWKELRKPWKEIFNNSKTFIGEVRSFFGNLTLTVRTED